MRKLLSYLFFFLILTISLPINAQVNYQPFEWAEIELDGKMLDKAAMLIPVKFPGITKTFYMQFDTGCQHTFFYGKIMLKHGIFKTTNEVVNFDFSWMINDTTIEYSSSAWVGWDTDDSIITGSDQPIHNIVGTIGADILRKKIMIIHFRSKRFIVLSDAKLMPYAINFLPNYSPMKIKNDRFFIDIMIGEDTLKDVFYDTGSSTTFLLLPLEDWITATGKNLEDEGVEKTFTISWGDTLDNYKALLKNDLIISGLKIPSPPIDYVDWESDANFKLIGNAPFYDSHTVILDCINSMFGLWRFGEEEIEK